MDYSRYYQWNMWMNQFWAYSLYCASKAALHPQSTMVRKTGSSRTSKRVHSRGGGGASALPALPNITGTPAVTAGPSGASNNTHFGIDLCPQCQTPFNNTSARSVQESCGHVKCRTCFISNEDGCPQCKDEERRACGSRGQTSFDRRGPGGNSRLDDLDIPPVLVEQPRLSQKGPPRSPSGLGVLKDSGLPCLGPSILARDENFKTVDFEGLELMTPSLEPIYSSQNSVAQFKVDYLPDEDFALDDGLSGNYSSIMSLVQEESEFSKSLLGLRKAAEPLSDPLAAHDLPSRLNGGVNHLRGLGSEGLVTRGQSKELAASEKDGLKRKPSKDVSTSPPLKLPRGSTKEFVSKRPTRNHLQNNRTSPAAPILSTSRRRTLTSPTRLKEGQANGKVPAPLVSKRPSRSGTKTSQILTNHSGEVREKRLSSLRSSAGSSSGASRESPSPLTATLQARKASISPKPAESKLLTRPKATYGRSSLHAEGRKKDLLEVRIDSVKSLSRPKAPNGPALPENKTLNHVELPDSPPCLSLVEKGKDGGSNGKFNHSDSNSFPSLNENSESSADVSFEGSFRDSEPHTSAKYHSKKKKKRCPVTIYDHITILQGDPQMYQCNVCMKKFKTKAHIKYHEFCQNGEKPFKCEQCGQGFIAKSHYEYHLRTHTGERPYVCPKCGKGFNQRGKVTRHMRSHTGEKPFVCQECGRGFANAQALRSHFLIHTGERPFACQYCNKRFTGMTNLKKHVITHTGERPFMCTHCGKSFGLKWTLDLHLRTHSSERPYACDQCSRAFSNSKDLRRHLVIHSGERPFKCWICGTAFRRKDNLDRHIKNTHNQPKEIAKQLANEAAAQYMAENKNRPNPLIKPSTSKVKPVEETSTDEETLSESEEELPKQTTKRLKRIHKDEEKDDVSFILVPSPRDSSLIENLNSDEKETYILPNELSSIQELIEDDPKLQLVEHKIEPLSPDAPDFTELQTVKLSEFNNLDVAKILGSSKSSNATSLESEVKKDEEPRDFLGKLELDLPPGDETGGSRKKEQGICDGENVALMPNKSRNVSEKTGEVATKSPAEESQTEEPITLVSNDTVAFSNSAHEKSGDEEESVFLNTEENESKDAEDPLLEKDTPTVRDSETSEAEGTSSQELKTTFLTTEAAIEIIMDALSEREVGLDPLLNIKNPNGQTNDVCQMEQSASLEAEKIASGGLASYIENMCKDSASCKREKEINAHEKNEDVKGKEEEGKAVFLDEAKAGSLDESLVESLVAIKPCDQLEKGDQSELSVKESPAVSQLPNGQREEEEGTLVESKEKNGTLAEEKNGSLGECKEESESFFAHDDYEAISPTPMADTEESNSEDNSGLFMHSEDGKGSSEDEDPPSLNVSDKETLEIPSVSPKEKSSEEEEPLPKDGPKPPDPKTDGGDGSPRLSHLDSLCAEDISDDEDATCPFEPTDLSMSPQPREPSPSQPPLSSEKDVKDAEKENKETCEKTRLDSAFAQSSQEVEDTEKDLVIAEDNDEEMEDEEKEEVVWKEMIDIGTTTEFNDECIPFMNGDADMECGKEEKVIYATTPLNLATGTGLKLPPNPPERFAEFKGESATRAKDYKAPSTPRAAEEGTSQFPTPQFLANHDPDHGGAENEFTYMPSPLSSFCHDPSQIKFVYADPNAPSDSLFNENVKLVYAAAAARAETTEGARTYRLIYAEALGVEGEQSETGKVQFVYASTSQNQDLTNWPNHSVELNPTTYAPIPSCGEGSDTAQAFQRFFRDQQPRGEAEGREPLPVHIRYDGETAYAQTYLYRPEDLSLVKASREMRTGADHQHRVMNQFEPQLIGQKYEEQAYYGGSSSAEADCLAMPPPPVPGSSKQPGDHELSASYQEPHGLNCLARVASQRMGIYTNNYENENIAAERAAVAIAFVGKQRMLRLREESRLKEENAQKEANPIVAVAEPPETTNQYTQFYSVYHRGPRKFYLSKSLKTKND